VKPLIIHSAHELLATVRAVRLEWKVPEQKELWFRAEDTKYSKTTLQPKLYRPAEGKPRKSVSKLLRYEYDCQEEFLRCADQLCESKLDSDAEWDWYFLSQHHGVPTRLLDWSDGALVALHFAVHGKTAPAKTDASIYILQPYHLLKTIRKLPSYDKVQEHWNKYRRKRKYEGLSEDDWDDTYLSLDSGERRQLPLPDAPLLWDSPHVSRRIAAQRSRFMIFGADPEWLSRLVNKEGAQLRQVTIPKEDFTAIRHELRDAGVTESVIFPDLDGLGREIEQEWADRL
jgi:hypothetical protein